MAGFTMNGTADNKTGVLGVDYIKQHLDDAISGKLGNYKEESVNPFMPFTDMWNYFNERFNESQKGLLKILIYVLGILLILKIIIK